MPTAFSASGNGLAASSSRSASTASKPRFMLSAVVAVADRLVERGQFVRMVDHRPGDGLIPRSPGQAASAAQGRLDRALSRHRRADRLLPAAIAICRTASK